MVVFATPTPSRPGEIRTRLATPSEVAEEHLYSDLKTLKKGSTVRVALANRANVRLMTSSEYSKFKRGQRHRYCSGHATRSPVSITVPSTGHWILVLDLGGLRGTIRYSVSVTGPPPGLLFHIGAQSSLRDVQVREPLEPVRDVLGGQTWDVFISHASKDKSAVAVPLRDALVAMGVSVWLDKTELVVGDSLRRKIDQGMRSSRIAVVVLSQNFFGKGWTNHELDGLVTRSVEGKQTLLPIWHNLSAQDVRAYSPSLADKVALSTISMSIEAMAEAIATVVGRDVDDEVA
jgi:hypothetical protein